MSHGLRRRYVVGGEAHTVRLEQAGEALRACIDGESGESCRPIDARLVRRIPGGAELLLAPGGRAVVVRDGDRVHVALAGRTFVLTVASERGADGGAAAVDEESFAESPMTGVVLSVAAEPGAAAAAGDVLFVVEAMKMEFSVEAPRAVVVDQVLAAAGDRVDIGQRVVTFREDAAAGENA